MISQSNYGSLNDHPYTGPHSHEDMIRYTSPGAMVMVRKKHAYRAILKAAGIKLPVKTQIVAILIDGQDKSVEFKPRLADGFVIVTSFHKREGRITTKLPVEAARLEYRRLVKQGYVAW